ncbi:hypothetical protein ACFS25_28280, partial [Spirosoma flavum]
AGKLPNLGILPQDKPKGRPRISLAWMCPKVLSTLRLLKPIKSCFIAPATRQQVSNDQKGITDFLKVLRQQTKASSGQCLFCLEFTGIYNNPLLKKLHQLSASIWIERAVHIQESIGLTRGKTDRAGGPAN